MAILTPYGRTIVPYVPGFDDGTTGGTGGTVSDGGQAGRITFTLPASGQTDADDGCYIAWRARDVTGKLLPDCPPSLSSASDVRALLPYGAAQVEGVTAPTLGNGVRVGVAVVAAPSAANVTKPSAQGYGAELDYLATPGVRASIIRSGGWAVSSAETHSTINRVRVAGDMLRNAIATGLSSDADVARGGRYIGSEYILGSGNAGDSIWLVVYAYRTGASSGSETVTVDVEARLQTSGVLP